MRQNELHCIQSDLTLAVLRLTIRDVDHRSRRLMLDTQDAGCADMLAAEPVRPVIFRRRYAPYGVQLDLI